MAKSKKTFIFYNDRKDYVDEMTEEEAGSFLKSILAYQNGAPPKIEGGLKFIWGRIKKQLDEDKQKREEEIEKRRVAGKNGGLAKASKCYKNLANASNCQEKLANDSKRYQMLANATSTVEKQDLKAKKESEGIYNINNIKLYSLVELFTREKITNYKQIYTLSKKNGEKKYFYTQYLEAEKIVKKIGIETFETILKFCLVSEFWKNQILSIAKLNKKNKDGAYYYDVMIDKIKEGKPSETEKKYSTDNRDLNNNQE